MSNVELFHYLLLLICGAGALTWLAERIAIPPAVVLPFGGCVIAVAGKRAPEMDPNLMLAAVQPLLISSSFYTAWKEFREEPCPPPPRLPLHTRFTKRWVPAGKDNRLPRRRRAATVMRACNELTYCTKRKTSA